MVTNTTIEQETTSSEAREQVIAPPTKVPASTTHDQERNEATVSQSQQQPSEGAQKSAAMNRIFASDDRLDPATVSEMLGITMDASDVKLTREQEKLLHPPSRVATFISIFLISIGITSLLLFGLMYHMKIGIFHPTYDFTQS